MKKTSSNWYILPDHAATLFPLVAIITFMVVVPCILAVAQKLRSMDVSEVFFDALGIAAVGIALLFAARLPLYRRRQFWTVGLRQLDRRHRFLYGLAYLFVFASVGLFFVILRRF